MARMMINASELADDQETADYLFETSNVDYSSDPLQILLQRELEEDEDITLWYSRQYN